MKIVVPLFLVLAVLALFLFGCASANVEEKVLGYSTGQFSIGGAEFKLSVPTDWNREVGEGVWVNTLIFRGKSTIFSVRVLDLNFPESYDDAVPYANQYCLDKAVSMGEWNETVHKEALSRLGFSNPKVLVKNCCGSDFELSCQSSAINSFGICDTMLKSFNCTGQ